MLKKKNAKKIDKKGSLQDLKPKKDIKGGKLATISKGVAQVGLGGASG